MLLFFFFFDGEYVLLKDIGIIDLELLIVFCRFLLSLVGFLVIDKFYMKVSFLFFDVGLILLLVLFLCL